jgi:hypothetical protein
MILVLLSWLIVGFCLLMIGFFTTKIITRFAGYEQVKQASTPDEFFLTGLISLSVISGIISVWFPVGNSMLMIVCLLSVVIFIFNFNVLKVLFIEFRLAANTFSKRELLFLLFVFFFILSAVVHRITLGDTESYHAQSIQWVRKYSVVPGLGNIHGRLAFNSMFFVISGLFTFQFKDILIYPLNGICYLVLALKLSSLSFAEFRGGILWKALFYLLLMLISVLILLPDLNSPAPDVICSIIIMYVFTMILENRMHGRNLSNQQTVLLTLSVFTSISFKLSSIFLIITLLLVLDKNVFKRILLTSLAGMIVLSSFFIRNYYLSGYLVYPYPKADYFNVDWKIPLNNVHEMKLEIESWARIPAVSSAEVDKIKLQDWVPVWFKALNFNNKVLVLANILLLLLVPVSIFRKDYLVSVIQAFILLNLCFWFLMAPDPRFAYGFLFTGFALAISYFAGLFETGINKKVLHKISRIGLACFIVVIIGRRIMSPVGTLINPSLWVVPASFRVVETTEYDAGFKYMVPNEDVGCCNTEIPCVPYTLSDIVLRGKDLQDGFKTIDNR